MNHSGHWEIVVYLELSVDIIKRYICEWYLGQRKSGAILFFPYEVYLKIEFENGKSTKAEIINRDTKL